LVTDSENVELIIGFDAPKIGVGFSKGVQLIVSSARNNLPLVECRHSEGVLLCLIDPRVKNI